MQCSGNEKCRQKAVVQKIGRPTHAVVTSSSEAAVRIAETGRVKEMERYNSRANYLHYLRHKVAYEYIADRCHGASVLDYGCGYGYGSSILAGVARKVLAVDVEAKVLEEAERQHPSQNIEYRLIMPGDRLGSDVGTFDVVVSCQVIEHVDDVRIYLDELSRLLTPQGLVYITTPNRQLRLLPFQKPWNPAHIREYSLAELAQDLSLVFSRCKILGLKGNSEIMHEEITRLRKTSLQALALGILSRCVGGRFVETIKAKYSKQKGCLFTGAKEELDQNCSIDETFAFSERNRHNCLDFLAICGRD